MVWLKLVNIFIILVPFVLSNVVGDQKLQNSGLSLKDADGKNSTAPSEMTGSVKTSTTIALKTVNKNSDDDEDDNENQNDDEDDDDDVKPNKEAREKVKQKNKHKPKKPKRKLSEEEKNKYRKWKKSQKKSKKLKKKLKAAPNDTLNDDDDEFDEEAAENFIETDERIQKHNKKKESSYSLGHNKYSDRSTDENFDLRGGLVKPNNTAENDPSRRVRQVQLNRPIPAAVNYTRSMKPVRDQRDCGACYAFAALAAVEYDAKISRKNNSKKIASEQDAIDCDILSFGCEGGWPSRTLQYARDFGVSDGAEYKYQNSRQLCLRKYFGPIFKLNKTCEEFLNGNETRLLQLVAQKPIVVGFTITENFMYYKTGVFSDPKCPKEINHALVVVGYGYDKNSKKYYWIVRNSWSKSWGMQGYAWVERNAPNGGNMCGIASYAMYVC